MAHRDDAERIDKTHNTARFFTENQQISWVLLAATLLWGIYGYIQMPKRKDPDVPGNIAAAVAVWPGASSERIEALVTRRIEEKIAENSKIAKIESISRNSITVVIVELDQRVTEIGKEFDDIKLKLDGIHDLPDGTRPIEFIKDFGETAALMLTVASPKVGDVERSLRARHVREAIERVRAAAAAADRGARASLVTGFPESLNPALMQRQRDVLIRAMKSRGIGRDVRPIDGSGFVGVDAIVDDGDDNAFRDAVSVATSDIFSPADRHPDVWPPAVIRNPASADAALAAVAGDKYSYRELDDLTDSIKRSLQTVPQVSKISRVGILDERVFLEYSQERLASFGIQAKLSDILGARNITQPGGLIEAGGKAMAIDPSGEFKSEKEIGDVMIGASASGVPAYLRDGVDIVRGYDTPPRYLNFLNWRDDRGAWHRSRAITLAINLRPGEQIAAFGHAVDDMLTTLKARLPEDLIIAKTSDQPRQVEESIDLFMRSLYEAIALVILVALIGFWEWRSAALLALSIPLTLAMTFGFMKLLNLDVQGVSIASLIIALGLLVDDPVVAGDAVKRELDAGEPSIVAAWLGPTKLATAIMFATITNIVAYLPFLLISGITGRFIYSLPMVLAASLVASRIVSMTFIPSLSYYILRPTRKRVPTMEERRTQGFTGAYFRLAGWCVDHRWFAFAVSIALLAAGLFFSRNLKQQFFPKDQQYLSYVDVWLPEDATLAVTNEAAQQAEAIIRKVADDFGRTHSEDGKPRQVLKSITAFVGGGGPRFWFSVSPELYQLNYAQLVIEVEEKHDTNAIVADLQKALDAGVPGARIDVRQLETGRPIGIPVAIRVSGDDQDVLRGLANKVADILRATPGSDRVRDDWGAQSFAVKLTVDPGRANMSGISNLDVAVSSAAAMNGIQVTTLRDGEKQIPVLARLRTEERAKISDIQSLYVYSLSGPQKVPLGQVSSVEYRMVTEKLRRRNQFRTITVGTFPVPGALPSEVLNAARPRLTELAKSLPLGYKLEIGGEEEEQVKGFGELQVVLTVSIAAIFLALVFQFRNAVKPFIVFSAIPYGAVGALVALAIMGSPFGFMAFLGIISLIGVIVSHVIVLFDFIEERHHEGAPFREALLDAGIVRLRPVMITVGATVFGLVPLALHGGPLWEPLCYTQIGGLLTATFITLLLVPVLYAIFVLDLKIVKWGPVAPHGHATNVSV